MCWIINIFTRNKKFKCDVHGINACLGDCHWTTDWDKATYKIKKVSNDNGDLRFTVYRTLFGVTEMISHWMGHPTIKEAISKVESDKLFYQEEWNRINTKNEEWIEVE